jgi:phosphoglycerol transferase
MENILNKYLLNIAVFAFCVQIVGCGDRGGDKAPVASIPEPLPRYSSTLEEGIDFKKNGYPTFLTDVSGISGQEEWGRWTDSNLGAIRFDFADPLPSKFTFEIQAYAIGPNEGKNISIRTCDVVRDIVITNEPPDQFFKVNFEGVKNCKSLEIVPPKPTSPHDLQPQNPDTRLLSLGLKKIRLTI